ncbi:unnamed protein product [Paramecium sonneborni]|uniref:Uncharacterized protein n=1 Tax=Paramecium sonneborni TaxID=65129 RepID=A0A8S1KVK8_9CILI|nr:unnamed protein product [Paramecium sonneborni]
MPNKQKLYHKMRMSFFLRKHSILKSFKDSIQRLLLCNVLGLAQKNKLKKNIKVRKDYYKCKNFAATIIIAGKYQYGNSHLINQFSIQQSRKMLTELFIQSQFQIDNQFKLFQQIQKVSLLKKMET